jgi:hypothetical protein
MLDTPPETIAYLYFDQPYDPEQYHGDAGAFMAALRDQVNTMTVDEWFGMAGYWMRHARAYRLANLVDRVHECVRFARYCTREGISKRRAMLPR